MSKVRRESLEFESRWEEEGVMNRQDGVRRGIGGFEPEDWREERNHCERRNGRPREKVSSRHASRMNR